MTQFYAKKEKKGIAKITYVSSNKYRHFFASFLSLYKVRQDLVNMVALDCLYKLCLQCELTL